MVGDVIIQSSHGLLSKTEFKGKKLFSGKSKAHHFNTVITSTDSKPLYEIEGCWTGDSIYTFIDPSAENLENKAVGDLFCSFDAVPSTEITVNGSEGVKEWQSRNAWKDVAISIREGDFNGAQTAKVKLEVSPLQLNQLDD